MAKLLFHLDTSGAPNAHFESLFSHSDTRSFAKASLMFEILETDPKAFPFTIFIGSSTPHAEGLEIVKWLKRHSKFHHIPVVMMVDQVSDEIRGQGKKIGVFDFIKVPFGAEEAKEILRRCDENALDRETLSEMDREFAAELSEQLESYTSLLSSLDIENSKELYRILHTIKGGSSSLQFPHIAEIVHKAESLLSTLQATNRYQDTQALELLGELATYLSTQIEGIRKESLLLPADSSLFIKLGESQKRIADLGQNSEDQKHTSAQSDSKHTSTNDESLDDEGNGVVVSKSATSMRISNQALDDLQDGFKKVLQIRTKISSFANSLKSEFPDELFPNDLLKIVKDLGDTSAKIMEFFINLRVVPVSRLKGFCSRLVQQTSSQLAKKCQFVFTADNSLELDQSIMSVLEGSLTHLIRNSMDHGLESPAERTTTGKEETGTLKLEIARLGNDQIQFSLSDDGKGINIDKLKAIVIEKGIFSETALDSMGADRLAELIFVDGLSTRTEVSDTSGRGVGMSAVKADIEGLGGQLKIKTEQSKGTTFTMIVPRFFKL